MPQALAIFDCDGTLVDSQGDIWRAMAMAYAACGLEEPTRHEVRGVIGLSLDRAVMRLMEARPEADWQHAARVEEAYKDNFYQLRMAGQLDEPLYDGIAGLLDTLRSADVALAVATGKSMRGLKAVLARHDLSGHFVSLQTADNHPSKPHPSMIHTALKDGDFDAAHTVMIGDTTYDIDMARAAGVVGLGVDWGYHKPEHLMASGAHSVSKNVDSLFQAIEATILKG